MEKTFKGKNFTAVFTDENGYFSLTGEVSGASGAVGEQLVEIEPAFRALELLHLCDAETGRPMHAWENARYYAKELKWNEAAKALHMDDTEAHKSLARKWIALATERGMDNGPAEIQAEIEAVWFDRISDLDDDLEQLADKYAPENRPEFVDPVDENGDVLHCYADIDSDDLDRMTALARHLNCNISDVEPARYGQNIFEAEGKEFAVLTDSEADDLWDDDLENYIDDCLEIPENMKNYFDREAWKRDAKMDGRGHALGRYDGQEYAEYGIKTVSGSELYYIYRQ